MCGIAGILNPGWSQSQRTDACSSLASALAHRGPDDQGHYAPPDQPVGLCHRRLSIIDTSAAGHQPMVSSSGRWVMVFNGEIYNADELRSSCTPAPGFRGHSDSEVLCELIDAHGPGRAAELAVGMFAFAAWDTSEQTLYLVRDRIGIKPLYICRNGSSLAFASEVGALRKLTGMLGGVSRKGLSGYLRFGYVPGNLSIYENASKVDPGGMIEIRSHGSDLQVKSTRWWDIREVVGDPLACTSEEAVDMVRGVVGDCVRDRLVSDRPLGAFLSGGIDSSLVVATMAGLVSGSVRTYSIGFEQAMYDESGHARSVANHLGTDHTERIVKISDVTDIVPRLGGIFDEPFADSSQIPTALVCGLARNDVVVALSGDGGDELFCGYDRYMWSERIWSVLSRIPLPLRQAMSTGLAPIPPSIASMLGSTANALLPRRMKLRNPTDKLSRIRLLLPARDVHDLYWRLLGYWQRPGMVLLDDPMSDFGPRTMMKGFPDLDPQHGMMMADMLGYLPNDILVKVDRTSMNVGLEARVPLLDHRLVELAWRLPLSMKCRDGVGKWPLRRVLADLVPSEHWDRPKQGFGVPIGEWLRGPLRAWAEEYLSTERLDRDGFFRTSVIRRTWQRHLSGRSDAGGQLWTLLMFNSWLDSTR